MLGGCPICLKSMDLGVLSFFVNFLKLAILGRYDNLTSMLCKELEKFRTSLVSLSCKDTTGRKHVRAYAIYSMVNRFRQG